MFAASLKSVKTCPVCNKEPVHRYNKCRLCYNAYVQAWRERNRARAKEISQKWYDKERGFTLTEILAKYGSYEEYRRQALVESGKKTHERALIRREAYMYLGRFLTSLEAAYAYDAKCKELNGQYAVLNFPENLSK